MKDSDSVLRFCLTQVGQSTSVDVSPSSEDLGADLATGTAPDIGSWSRSQPGPLPHN